MRSFAVIHPLNGASWHLKYAEYRNRTRRRAGP